MRRILAAATAGLVALASGGAAAGQLTPRVPADVTVALAGLSSFKGTLRGNCQIDARERQVTVDAKGDTVFLRFSVDQTAAGPFKVLMEGLLKPKDAPFARFNDLLIGQDHYLASSGAGTLADAAGRAGRFHAEGFIKAGGPGLQTQNLKADVTWKCQ